MTRQTSWCSTSWCPASTGSTCVAGFGLCSEFPVILLTARGEESDRITGLELGADDYVVKPFSPRDSSSESKQSCAGPGSGTRQVPDVLEIAALTIDRRSRRVLRRGLGDHSHGHRVRPVVLPGQPSPHRVLA